MYIIGLTGGIGTGKSTVAAELAKRAAVIDADTEGHLAYRSGTLGWRRIIEMFGAQVLDEEGEVDRQRLSRIVFGDPQALALLNSLIHPLIRQRIGTKLAELQEGGTRVAVVDAAVLYQAGWEDLTDEVWLVSAPAAAVVPRLEERGLARGEARRRVNLQEPAGPADRADAIDAIIENTGSLEDLRAKVDQLWNERISLTRQ